MKKDEKMSIEDMTAYMRIVPERKASYAEFPDTMNDEICLLYTSPSPRD